MSAPEFSVIAVTKRSQLNGGILSFGVCGLRRRHWSHTSMKSGHIGRCESVMEIPRRKDYAFCHAPTQALCRLRVGGAESISLELARSIGSMELSTRRQGRVLLQ
jgi:hypothetical protein